MLAEIGKVLFSSVHCANHELPLFTDDSNQTLKQLLDPMHEMLREMRKAANLLDFVKDLELYCIENKLRVRHIADDVEQRWLRHLLQATDVAIEMYPIYLLVFLKFILKELCFAYFLVFVCRT